MSETAPLLRLTRSDGDTIYVQISHIVKITPADPQPATDAGPRPESGSILTVATGAGTANIGVTEYLLHESPLRQEGFLRLTDIQGRPIKVNAAYVAIVRARDPAGAVLEIPGSTGLEAIPVHDSLADVLEWWARFVTTSLLDPGRYE